MQNIEYLVTATRFLQETVVTNEDLLLGYRLDLSRDSLSTLVLALPLMVLPDGTESAFVRTTARRFEGCPRLLEQPEVFLGVLADLIAANRRLAEETLYRLRKLDKSMQEPVVKIEYLSQNHVALERSQTGFERAPAGQDRPEP